MTGQPTAGAGCSAHRSRNWSQPFENGGRVAVLRVQGEGLPLVGDRLCGVSGREVRFSQTVVHVCGLRKSSHVHLKNLNGVAWRSQSVQHVVAEAIHFRLVNRIVGSIATHSLKQIAKGSTT